MSSDAQRRYVDAVSMSDEQAHVYEAIAALEYSGRPASRREIVHAAGLDESTVDDALHALTEREAVLRRGSGEDAEYEPANREWMVTPPGE